MTNQNLPLLPFFPLFFTSCAPMAHSFHDAFSYVMVKLTLNFDPNTNLTRNSNLFLEIKEFVKL
jgi:hypothetical protein